MRTEAGSRQKKLLFFVTEDSYFYSHRLALAIAAKQAGYDVVVATRVNQHAGRITQAGLRLIPIRLVRQGKNPWRELLAIREIVMIYRQEKPDIVHHVALKPVLYGTVAARIAGVPAVVNALAGLGYSFSTSHWKARLSRPLLKGVLRLLLNGRNSKVILQNPDDRNFLIAAKVTSAERIQLIKGSGVNLQRFFHFPEPDSTVTVILAARMLWDKGVGEFVEAAGILRRSGVMARFVIAGASDSANPSKISTRQLEDWHVKGDVEWWGHQENMPDVFAQSHIICLPSSYAEGIPLVLIEAAACGRPIVTTDAPGCREIVRDGENGILVPVRKASALAHALRCLIEDAGLRKTMGRRGREMAEAEFSIETIVSETLGLYQRLLN